MRHNHSSHRRIPPTFDELLSRGRDLPKGYEGHILEGGQRPALEARNGARLAQLGLTSVEPAFGLGL
jgi:hypothetical protein